MPSPRRLLPAVCLVLCSGGLHAAPPEGNVTALLRQADPALQTQWGQRYEHGEGVTQSYPQAIALYCAAAARGHAEAQYQLGWLYANGRGVEQDDAQAAAWFRLAAVQGDAYARRMLPRVEQPGQAKKPARCETPPAAESPAVAVRARPPGNDSLQRQEIAALVDRLAPGYGLDPDLVMALIETESNFRSEARSPKNALGLMQLIPATAERFGVRDPFDPVQNLHGGMAYLRWLLVFFGGDLQRALAGYNAGEQAVLRYNGIPPYTETRLYVDKITRRYGRLTHPPLKPATPAAVRPSQPS